LREADFAASVAAAGGEAYIAGGWVRDAIRRVAPHDRDYVTAGMSAKTFEALFPSARRVGRSFPVYRLSIGGEFCDVALARRETKTGPGYRGFDVSSDESTTIRDDLERRDTTINSMAVSLSGGELIDPFGGAEDIRRRVIRATSARFRDDPVRALRAARQAAQFGYEIEPGTLAMMRHCRDELANEPGERIAGELSRALDTDRPSVFFRALLNAGLLGATFPQIYALVGAEQDPARRPAGDTFERAMASVDAAAGVTRRVEVRFAALAHDIGKGLVPPGERPRYHSHERRSLDALAEWNRMTPLPALWLSCARFAMRERMRASRISKPEDLVDFLMSVRRHPIGVDGMSAIVTADASELPEALSRADEYLGAMDAISGRDIPENLAGPERGEWLRQRRIEAIARLSRNEERDLKRRPWASPKPTKGTSSLGGFGQSPRSSLL
jgi:tRNA nucleotidyltransferase (CCA-adding enzyme)